ncbi:hypothetical protein [Breoghania sp.]|uniref:hypothetical protein n=1 Tax=Breoghania sp. TaxID=2065378 RepID=UPI002AA8A208|nr:hypothetical protein [Breoghania sp.]
MTFEEMMKKLDDHSPNDGRVSAKISLCEDTEKTIKQMVEAFSASIKALVNNNRYVTGVGETVDFDDLRQTLKNAVNDIVIDQIESEVEMMKFV